MRLPDAVAMLADPAGAPRVELAEVSVNPQLRLSSEDPVRLETDLHFLKGCAWNLGFSAFGGLCDEGERQIGEDRSAQISIADVMTCYSESKKMLMQGLDAALHPLRRAQ